MSRTVRGLIYGAAIGIAVVAGSASSFANAMVSVAPPPPRAEVIPALPAPEAAEWAWSPGYWRWTGAEYFWVPGSYVRRVHGAAALIPGYWASTPAGWVWVPGHWG
jgi:WXXGXW repeat (2 copies)